MVQGFDTGCGLYTSNLLRTVVYKHTGQRTLFLIYRLQLYGIYGVPFEYLDCTRILGILRSIRYGIACESGRRRLRSYAAVSKATTTRPRPTAPLSAHERARSRIDERTGARRLASAHS